jgi:hypothetical protein
MEKLSIHQDFPNIPTDIPFMFHFDQIWNIIGWVNPDLFIVLEDKQVCTKLLQLNHGRVWGVNWSIGQLTSCLVHPLYLGVGNNASALGETND